MPEGSHASDGGGASWSEDPRLVAHLRSWVGDWPPTPGRLRVVASPRATEPGWDGKVRRLTGVGDGSGTLVGVPEDAVDDVQRILDRGEPGPGGSADLGRALGDVLGVTDAVYGVGVFRTTTEVSGDLEDVGEWSDAHEGWMPDWLAPFNGPLLVVRDDDGEVLTSVGIKVHDAHSWELAVVTEEAARGRGLGARVVATAARRALAEGRIPTYLHDPANTASARLAALVGFEDRGWTVHGLWGGA